MRFNSSCSATHLFISPLFLFQLPQHNYYKLWSLTPSTRLPTLASLILSCQPSEEKKNLEMHPLAPPFFYIIYVLPDLLPTLDKVVLGLLLPKAASLQWMQPFMSFQTATFNWFLLSILLFHYEDLFPLTLKISTQTSQVFEPQANFLAFAFAKLKISMNYSQATSSQWLFFSVRQKALSHRVHLAWNAILLTRLHAKLVWLL